MLIAAAGAGVPAIHQELLRAQPRLAGSLVEHRGVVHQFLPVGGRMEVHLDDARVGRDFEDLEPRIGGWRVAFETEGRAELRRGVFHRRHEFRGNPPGRRRAA